VNEYKVLLELMPQYQRDPKLLSMLYFKAPTGALIPLDTLAKVELTTGPLAISHFGQLAAVTISFNVKPGWTLGQALDQVDATVKDLVPESVSSSFQGAARAFHGSLNNLWLLLIVAIAVVYIVLGILYESFIHPITILSGLPSAGFGALLTLYVFHMDLNIYAFVGLIMLIGIVQKNAIMQIDFALEAEKSGMDPVEAIYKGCLVRFRPIMMTTMSAMLGAVPIAIGYGAGGEARQPLGMVVVGGLIFSQAVTLYLTPVMYTYLAALHGWWKSKRAPQQASEEVPA
jgi:hydrophobic/amphiphilic exporter-1 (mainly G- bacteria), HAE1 family